MKHRETTISLSTLANAAELVAIVCSELVGNELADQISGSELTRSTFHQLAQARFRKELGQAVGG